jgi:hypothetical protein
MDVKLQRYYEARFDMVSSVGWKDLIDDAEKMRKAIADITSIDSEKLLYLRKGQLDILDWLLTLKEVSEKVYEDLQNEGNE